MKVLLLSAYAAQSHVHWQRSLQAMLSDWQWQVLSLPPRHFSWRVRGNPLYWALAEREILEQEYDLLVATSMVDLATLRGLVPALATTPALLYFHENQFEYPRDRQQHSLLEAQMVSLYSALAADRVLFNSSYNRDSFLSGVAALLGRLPDRVPPGVVSRLRDKSGVLAVPVDVVAATIEESWPGVQGDLPSRPLRLLWAGRFEHDKGPDRLLSVLQQLEREGLSYELAVTGQQFRNSPAVFAQIERDFSHRLVQFGYVESRSDYMALLRGADLVLSTAVHEFQGLAVLEAVACACVPVVPGRLSYPEIYGERYCYASHPGDPPKEALAAARSIVQRAGELSRGRTAVPDVSAFCTVNLAPVYRAELSALVGLQDSQ